MQEHPQWYRGEDLDKKLKYDCPSEEKDCRLHQTALCQVVEVRGLLILHALPRTHVTCHMCAPLLSNLMPHVTLLTQLTYVACVLRQLF